MISLFYRYFVLILVVAIKPLSVNATEVNQMTQMDLKLFVETVGTLTGRSFILDPNIHGQVNVMMPTGIDENELYNFFLAVMDVHGYIPIDFSNGTKIVPLANTKPIDSVSLNRYKVLANERDTQIIHIQNIPVGQLVSTLQPLISSDAYISAVDLRNAIVISDTQHNISKLEILIKELDKPDNKNSIYISLKHVKALAIKDLLSDFLMSQNPVVSPSVLADEKTNSLIISATKRLLDKAQNLIKQLDIPGTPAKPLVNKVVYLQYSDADKAQYLLKELLSNNAADTDQLKELQIVADTAMNALFLKGSQQQITEAVDLVTQLDVRKAQVLVEVIIAELSSTKAAEIGVQWALTQGDFNALTSFNGTGPSLVELRSNPSSIGNGFSVGIGNFNDSGLDVGALIRALATDANTNIISTPTLLTLDNQEAQIVVGQNVPFITGQYPQTGGTEDGGSQSTFQTIKRQDVGLQLKIKPKISASGAIKLDIEQEVSSISQQSNQAADIITNKRSIKTQVIANHKDLIILGGLIDDNLQETSEKVPLLGDLPIIGSAFKYSKSALVKRNLVVFLRPTIIMDDAILNGIAHGKYATLRQLQLQARSNHLLSDQNPSFEALLSEQQQANDEPSTADQPDW